MRRVFIALTILFLCTSYSYCTPAVSSPRVHGAATGVDKKSNLFLLGKIWGFLKYHHPNVTKGRFDWDDQLVKMLPGYMACTGIDQRNELLQKWIDSLGKVPSFNVAPDTIRNIKFKPDFRWISNSRLSEGLVKQLTNLTNNHDPADQYYVRFMADDGVNIPLFIHEKAYNDATNLSLEFRLLAVFKFWNIIQYWYPYKYLTKDDWDNCLVQFIDEALNVKNDKDYQLLMQTMVAAIKDTHAGILSSQVEAENGKWEMPFSVKFVQNEAVIYEVNDALLKDKDIRVGNILESVNGVTVKQMLASKGRYISASNKAALLRELAKLVVRARDSVVNIVIVDNNNNQKKMAIKTRRYNSLAVKTAYDFPYQKDSSYFMIRSGILYVNMGTLKETQVPLLKSYLKTAKGIILDNRQYPKHPASYVITELLLPHKTAFAKFTSVVPGYPGLFQYSKPSLIGIENPDYFKGKVAILVNEETQSTGEFLTMAFKAAPNAVVVGSETAGADGNTSPLFLFPGRYFFSQITALGVYYPDGKETQQVGIVPDIRVEQTISGLRNHKDELLEKAISAIDSQAAEK